MKDKNQKKTKILVNSYLFILITIGSILLLASLIYMFYLTFHNATNESIKSDMPGLIVLCVPYAIFFIACAVMSHEIYGYFVFDENKLVFRAPLRKTIQIQYSDINYIQIDYNNLTINNQFWVILGLEPMSDKYRHKVNAMPITDKVVRIQYSEKLDKALCSHLTGKQYKEYIHSKTTLRAFKANEY